MWSVYRKEMRHYLLTPLAWVVWVAFLLLIGVVFSFFVGRVLESAFGAGGDQGLTELLFTPYFGNGFVRFVLLFTIPMLSMRLFAEERHSGTLELLFTYPLTELQLILGKLLAALSVAAVMLALTFPPIFWVSRYGGMDWPVVFCCYLGLMLMLLVFLSFGMFASSLTNSQVVALIITWIGLMALWLAGALADAASANPAMRLIHELSLLDHFNSFNRGIINSNDVIFYLSLAAFFVFLTTRQLEARKWRG